MRTHSASQTLFCPVIWMRLSCISFTTSARSSAVSASSIRSALAPTLSGTPIWFHHQLGLRKRPISQKPSALWNACSVSGVRRALARVLRFLRCSFAGHWLRSADV